MSTTIPGGPSAPVRDAVGHRPTPGPAARARRRLLVITAIVGVALIVMPAVFQMFSRAPKGASMLTEFKPFMTNARLTGYQNDIAEIRTAVAQTSGSAGPALAAHGSALPASYTSFAQQWPQVDSTMSSLLAKVHGNLGHYEAVAALPSFTLFPWFFVIPGILVAGLSIWALQSRSRAPVLALGAVGLGVALAPAIFGMFTRAPAGGRMMGAFKNIETTSNVTQIQGYFSSMAVGQGAIRLDVVPALESTGLSQSQIAAQYPAIATLDHDWVHILNDMTPMIGAMSDNVTNYQAVAALPPFPLFPYFFVLPGVIIAGLAVATVRSADPATQTEGAS